MPDNSRFHDRRESGRSLASLLEGYRDRNPLILALPRGGVPVAYEVAKFLHADLDLLIVRKLGVPQQPELAFGAIASGGSIVVNQEVVRLARLTQDDIDSVLERETVELERRERMYRGDRPPPGVKGRVVIVVDDGLATGASMEAAVAALRKLEAAFIVVAIPVAATESVKRIANVADDVVCAIQPTNFMAVGLWYEDFEQVNDETVRRLLGEYLADSMLESEQP